MRSVLAIPDYRRLITALALSEAGDWLYNVALLVLVYDLTDSPTWVAATTVVRLLPYVLFAAFGGVVAERHDVRTVMLVSDLSRAALMGILAVASATGAGAAVVIASAFVATAAGTAYLPAVARGIPVLVGEHHLAAANALRSTVTNVAVVMGPAIGGLVLVFGSPTIAFAANAGTFVASALVLRSSRSIPPLLPRDVRGSEWARRPGAGRVAHPCRRAAGALARGGEHGDGDALRLHDRVLRAVARRFHERR